MKLLLIMGLLLWTFFGGAICIIWSLEKDTDGWELCNPYWVYKYYKSVNWFGAIMLSLLYTVLCPIGAVCYWIYKLCTVGRRKKLYDCKRGTRNGK